MEGQRVWQRLVALQSCLGWMAVQKGQRVGQKALSYSQNASFRGCVEGNGKEMENTNEQEPKKRCVNDVDFPSKRKGKPDRESMETESFYGNYIPAKFPLLSNLSPPHQLSAKSSTFLLFVKTLS
ncbi:hypothetical protein QOT17_012618 [Balamuthia mandrillaris]